MSSDIQALIQSGFESYEGGDLDAALRACREAVRLAPDSCEARYNYGVVLRDLEKWDEAEAEFEAAIENDPSYAGAYNNLGIVYENIGRHALAIASYRAALALQPDFPLVQFNLGMLLLRLGHFQEGFARCEYRWQTDQFQPIQCPHPKWDGQPLDGTLLIHTEQGAGDAIQFVRYVPLAAARCRRVLFVCVERLHRLFAKVPGIDEMRRAGQFRADSFVAYTPLMSLPHLCGTTLETIPATGPYLSPPHDRVPLPPSPIDRPRLNVGICWAGSRTHRNDRHRSIALRQFAPLFALNDVAFFSLQYDESAEELPQFGGRIVDLRSLQNDWAEAASLVWQLDLLITVDTGVAHLAAAMGKPVWIAISKRCDWRWMVDRTDSPWYPSVRLFRQTQLGKWDDVFLSIRNALSDWARNDSERI